MAELLPLQVYLSTLDKFVIENIYQNISKRYSVVIPILNFTCSTGMGSPFDIQQLV